MSRCGIRECMHSKMLHLLMCSWFTILCPMNYSDFRMEVHSRMEVQNGISEWKCIPEWNIYVELNGPYGLPYDSHGSVIICRFKLYNALKRQASTLVEEVSTPFDDYDSTLAAPSQCKKEEEGWNKKSCGIFNSCVG